MGHPPARPVPGYEDLYAKFTFGVGVLFVALEFAYFVSAQSISLRDVSIDSSGFAIGRDFINSWMGGRSAFAGGPAAWFDFTAYNAALKDVTGRADFPAHFWSYPPHLVLFIWPLGLLPYLPAYLLWCAAGLALYMLAAWSGGADRARMLFLAVAPGVAVNVFFGQNGFLTAALMIGGLANLDRRPLLSGILLGMLTIKPQFGLLLPILLVMTGRWRVIAAATATVIALAAATAVWFGTDIWIDYVRQVAPQQHLLLIDAGNYGWPMVSSAFVNARRIGLPADWAWLVQAGMSSCAAAMVVWTFWRRRDPVLSLALFVTATFLFSPWMLNYDMVVFGFVVAVLRERNDNTAFDHGLGLAVWTLPLTMMPLGVADVPIAMMLLPAFAGRLIWRLARAKAPQTAADDASMARLGHLLAQE